MLLAASSHVTAVFQSGHIHQCGKGRGLILPEVSSTRARAIPGDFLPFQGGNLNFMSEIAAIRQ